MLTNHDAATAPLICDLELRRQIDRCIARALLDCDYARLLLAEPTIVLEAYNCLPQDYLSLRSIDARCLVDFAEQARALFWLALPSSGRETSPWPTRRRARTTPPPVATRLAG